MKFFSSFSTYYVPRKSDFWRRLFCWKRRIHWRPKGNISRKLDLSQGNHKIGKIRIWQPFFFLSVKSFVKGRGGREREREKDTQHFFQKIGRWCWWAPIVYFIQAENWVGPFTLYQGLYICSTFRYICR